MQPQQRGAQSGGRLPVGVTLLRSWLPLEPSAHIDVHVNGRVCCPSTIAAAAAAAAAAAGRLPCLDTHGCSVDEGSHLDPTDQRVFMVNCLFTLASPLAGHECALAQAQRLQ